MNKNRALNISYLTLLAVLSALCRFTIPGAIELPFTLQCVAAVIAGIVLGGRDGAISMLLYIALGLIGLPVFANGGGYLYVLEPTFGYVAALSLGAFVAGRFKSRFTTLSVTKLFFCAFFALTAIYSVGFLYQILIVCVCFESSFVFALTTLTPMPIVFIIHATILYFFCMFYPKPKTTIGEAASNGLCN